jgi:hypothetical protein
MLVSRPLTIPKILGGEARGRKKVRLATKWDNTPMKSLIKRYLLILVKRGGGNFQMFSFQAIHAPMFIASYSAGLYRGVIKK